METREITSKEAVAFVLPRHYSGRIPPVSKAFGLFDGDELKAVCTFGKPASPPLCRGVCGEEYKSNVYELNRLCRVEDLDYQLSQFVAECLRRLKPLNWIVVSYSDTQMNHHGYIYQACNFIYTGMTRPRTNMYTPDGKHCRHYKAEEQTGWRKFRSAKYRYVYFCASDKRQKKEMMKKLKYPIMPYPKGDNSNYVLGEYIQEVLVRDKKFL